MPHGHMFEWNGVSHSAYLYEAAMRYVQAGQSYLQQSQTLVGKQAYTAATTSAMYFATVLNKIMPLWTFRPHLLDDCARHDVYGHYCLARAHAFDAIGQADMTCSQNARIVAASNASHLYATAAHLISGDVSEYIKNAHHCVGKMLALRADKYLDAWKTDKDESGAASAVACLEEASYRFCLAGKGDCSQELQYAFDRNQVNYIAPQLPPWHELMRVNISPVRNIV